MNGFLDVKWFKVSKRTFTHVPSPFGSLWTQDWWSTAVVLKPVLEYPQPCTCMSPSSITPDSTHQLISGDCVSDINQIKSNLFIVTHRVHKCTDGEILRYKTLCHGSTSNKIWKMYNIHDKQYTHLHNIHIYTIYTFAQYTIDNCTQYTHLHNIHICTIFNRQLYTIYTFPQYTHIKLYSQETSRCIYRETYKMCSAGCWGTSWRRLRTTGLLF